MNSFIEALVAHMAATCGPALGASDSVPKVFTDFAAAVPLPWSRVTELGENTQYTTGTPYLATGAVQIDVFAAGRSQAKWIGDVVRQAVNDANLVFQDGRLMYLRVSSSTSVVETEIAPESPTVFHRALTFDYMIQRSL